jgi:hypothetical protein
VPTILFEEGFRIFFYSADGRERPHVHIEYGSKVAKFWIKPIGIASNYGMKEHELSRAAFLVRRHQRLIMERWNEYFGQEN